MASTPLRDWHIYVIFRRDRPGCALKNPDDCWFPSAHRELSHAQLSQKAYAGNVDRYVSIHCRDERNTRSVSTATYPTNSPLTNAINLHENRSRHLAPSRTALLRVEPEYDALFPQEQRRNSLNN